MSTKAALQDDGRINISLSSKAKLPELPPDYGIDLPEFAVDPNWKTAPSMAIVCVSRWKHIHAALEQIL